MTGREVTLRLDPALLLRLDLYAVSRRHPTTTAEALMGLLRDRLREESLQLTRCWPTHRSRVTHLFVPGAGAGDGSLCGVAFDGNRRPVHFGDPECQRCNRFERAMVRL